MDEFAEEINEGRKAAVFPTKGQRGEIEAQITTTKGNQRGHDTTTTTGGRMVLKKTRLCETNRGRPGRKRGRMEYRETRDISFDAISEASKVYDHSLYR